MWERARERVQDRVAEIEQAVSALEAGPLPEDQRERARVEAHRLAGLLGTLGVTAGSPVARRLELALRDRPACADAAGLQEDVRRLREIVAAGPGDPTT
nr:Hpt domain-containing protein [Patulibacter sp. SYSU D01012]